MYFPCFTIYMDFIAGLFGGTIGTLLGYPLDTLRVTYQHSNHTTLFSQCKELNKRGIHSYYKGVATPLLGIAIEKSIIFGVSDILSKYRIFTTIFDNTFTQIACSGMISGFISTLIVVPTEKIKLNHQYQRSIHWKNDIFKIHNLYKGWSISLLREVPGYAIYLTTYNQLKKNTTNMSLLHAPFYGALSGISAWVVIYPSDPIKTIMQLENNTMYNAITNIYNKYGIYGFYRGYSMALLRCIPIHGGVFFGYELVHKIKNK